MKGKSTLKVAKRTQRDYSLSFKLEVVKQIERDEFNFIQARSHYGIQGHCTVSKWLKKHSILDWKELPVMFKQKTPEQRIKELELLLAKEKEKVHVLNTVIDLTDEMLETDIRKKYMPVPSEKQKPRSSA